jgi:hypothetical protein
MLNRALVNGPPGYAERMARGRVTALVLVAVWTALACSRAGNPEDAPSSADPAAAFRQSYADVQAYPVFVSSELVTGPNRFLLGLLDANDAPIGDPGINVEVAFFDLEESATKPASRSKMDFLWAVPGERGLYVTKASFDEPGEWGAEVTMTGEGIDVSVKGTFEVTNESSTPELGERVPSSDTPTASDAGKLSAISTDHDPDPRFYETSVAEALARREPFVLVFATPKFCSSQVCGPTLDTVKSVARDFPGMTFIHVEPYELPTDGSKLVPVEAAQQWGLPSEPWVFVVDARGKLDAKYEGVVGAGELRSELSTLRRR